MITHRSPKTFLSRPRRSPKLIYILLQACLCVFLIRCQDTSRTGLGPGGQDSTSTQDVGQESITSSDTNDPSQFASNSDQAHEVTAANPSGGNGSDQAATNTNQASTSTDGGAQNVAAATTPTVSPATSPSAGPDSQASLKQDSQQSAGLSEGAIGGIVVASIVASITLITLAIMYFRKLERAIEDDKRQLREKQARKYNMTYPSSTPMPSYLPRTHPSPFEV